MGGCKVESIDEECLPKLLAEWSQYQSEVLESKKICGNYVEQALVDLVYAIAHHEFLQAQDNDDGVDYGNSAEYACRLIGQTLALGWGETIQNFEPRDSMPYDLYRATQSIAGLIMHRISDNGSGEDGQ